MESPVANCDREVENEEKECEAKSACAKETQKQESHTGKCEEVNNSSSETEMIPPSKTEVNHASGKAQASFPSLTGCTEALQKLLSANNVKRLIISSQSLTQTTTTETTTTSVLPSAAQAGPVTQVTLEATCATPNAEMQRDTLLQEQSNDIPENEAWKTPQVPEEIARFTPKPHIVDLPLDLIYTVPKVTTRIVKYTVEAPIPGISRLVPKAFPVDTPFIVPQISDVEVPVVMSQTFVPELEECSTVVDIPTARYVPKLIPVDVYVPRPVAIPIKTGELKQYSKPAYAPEQLLHQLSVEMNPHLVALNQFNTQQAAKFSTVVNRSVELANALGVPPPVPERIEVDPRYHKSRCTELVDERGFKQLNLNLDGKAVEHIEAVFQRVKKEADNSRKPVVQSTPVEESCIVSILDSGRKRCFTGVPSANTAGDVLPLAPQEQLEQPTPQRPSEGTIPDSIEDRTIAETPEAEEGTTAAARPGTASSLSD